MKQSIEVKELIYEGHLAIIGLTEFGISLNDLVAGKVSMPAGGAQFHIPFEGALVGEKINGQLKGVDYLRMRGDGRIELNLFGEVTLDDGSNIAWRGTGTGFLDAQNARVDFTEEINMFTNVEKHSWVNHIQFWGRGYADLQAQKIEVKTYLP